MAITAIAAIASAGAVSAGIVAVETLATIAVVTGVVGAVTGNKTLKSLAAGMGLGATGAGLLGAAGGVEAGAAGAGLSAGETGALDMGIGEAANASAGSGGIISNAAEGVSTFPVNGGELATPMPLSEVEQTSNAAQGGVNASVDASANSAVVPAAPEAGATQGINAPSTPADVGISGPNAPNSPADAGAAGPGMNAGQTGAMDMGGSGIQKPGSYWDGIKGFVKDNKELVNIAAQLGGGALSGASRAYEANRQYDINSGILNLKEQEAANAKSIPKINLSLNPNANVFSNSPPQYAGIIMSKRA